MNTESQNTYQRDKSPKLLSPTIGGNDKHQPQLIRLEANPNITKPKSYINPEADKIVMKRRVLNKSVTPVDKDF